MINNSIYEDAEMKVTYRQGTGDTLIILFGDAADAAKFHLSEYKGKKIVEHLNISCVVFQPKKTSWYPAESMRAASENINLSLDLTNFKNIVGYGASMGGYGVLKFAKLLRITHVIAYCPQWSIDPSEAHGANPGYSSNFDSNMRGHSVKKHELDIYKKGIYIVYDPRHAVDNYHAESYLIQNNDISMIPLRGAGHEIPKILIGRKYFSRLFAAVLEGDADEVRNTIVKEYRLTQFRYASSLQLASKRHPTTTAKIIIKNTNLYLTADNFFFNSSIESATENLIRQLLRHGRHNLARGLARLQACRETNESKSNIILERAKITESMPHLIRTKYNTYICYDKKTESFFAYKPEEIVARAANPVYLGYYNEAPYLFINKHDQRKICIMINSGAIVTREVPYLDGLTVSGYKIEANKNKVSLQELNNGQYCSVNQIGHATWDRSWARSDETFDLVSSKEC
jgi:hypothetical protein